MFTFKHIALIIIFISVSAFSQVTNVDSVKSKLNTSPLSSLADLHRYNPSLIKNYYAHQSNKEKKESIEMAKSSEFINSEKQLIDGTYWRTNSDISTPRLLTIFAGIATVDAIAYTYQTNIWYRENTTVFHTLDFYNDNQKWMYMDKMGHFLDAYFSSDLSAKAFRWAGVSGESSVWYGALTGWIWMLQIEISDGFMADWGFSWGDLLANTLGAGFFVLQQFNYDVLGGLHPKISWHKSDAWSNGLYYRDPGGPIEDYEGMTFWLGINPHHYFPKNMQRNYPEWLAPLGIAVGYGAKGIASNPWGGESEFFIGLDLDLRKIPIGDNSGFFRFLKSELNFLRMPLPTIRFSQSGVWFGLYF